MTGTFVVQLFSGNQLAMFMVPCVIGGFFILLFAATLRDRRLAKADKPTWSLRQFASTFYFNPLSVSEFDSVVDPVDVEPVVQCTLYLKVKHELAQ